MRQLFVIFICFGLAPHINYVRGQQFYRMKADFTIKEKHASGSSQLVMGTVYYDKAAKKIIYKINFPEKETWVVSDTTVYKFTDGKFKSRQNVPFMTGFSIFHLCLNGNLPNYGLDKEGSIYKLEGVEKEEEMIIATWMAEPAMRGSFGKVLISTGNKRLNGIVVFSPKEKIMKKEFFRDYSNTHGFQFPTNIIELNYTAKGENKKITSYKNIVVDDMREDNIYNYRLPN